MHHVQGTLMTPWCGGLLGAFGLPSPCPKRPVWAHGLPLVGEAGKAHHTHRARHAAGRRGTPLPKCGRAYCVLRPPARAAVPRDPCCSARAWPAPSGVASARGAYILPAGARLVGSLLLPPGPALP